MPAKDERKGQLTGRIRLDGGDELGERPTLSIHAVAERGDVLDSASVNEEGDFTLSEGAVAEARRIVVTERQADPNDPQTASYTLRPHTFRRELEAGAIGISVRDWSKFLPWSRHCIDATLQRCFPWRFVVDDLLVGIAELPLGVRPLDALRILPRHRCAPICEGLVEVYRKTCCCVYPEPPLDVEPFPELPEPLPDPFPGPVPGPFPGPFPDPFPEGPLPPLRPGPDPAPFNLQQTVLTGGAVDVAKVERLRQLRFAQARFAQAQFAQGEVEQPRAAFGGFAGAFGPPLCWCGPPVKVADGFVGDDGRIHLCWEEPFRMTLSADCDDTYAFVVKQNIAGSTVTIYDGPAAGQWFDASDDIELTSYHPEAVGCRHEEFPVPVEGPFVVLQDIGGTESHHLHTPAQDGPDSVAAPGTNSGLLDKGQDYALGGTLHLRYHFSEILGADMKAIGARYYRVMWAPADSNGNPSGGEDAWQPAAVPAWKTWRITSDGDVVKGTRSLGPEDPDKVNGRHDLHLIPYETGSPLEGAEEWQDGQYHAGVDTDSRPEGRYLLRLEVFDGDGNRLDPGGAGFTYRRWETETDTTPVTHAALTHLIWTDNRSVKGEIHDITGPGAVAGDCKFFEGSSSEKVAIEFEAFHPQPGTPSFMLSYTLNVRRGISGSDTYTETSSTERGESGPFDRERTIGALLEHEDKCSFAVTLHVRAKIHNGFSRLRSLDAHDIAAFAVEKDTSS